MWCRSESSELRVSASFECLGPESWQPLRKVRARVRPRRSSSINLRASSTATTAADSRFRPRATTTTKSSGTAASSRLAAVTSMQARAQEEVLHLFERSVAQRHVAPHPLLNESRDPVLVGSSHLAQLEEPACTEGPRDERNQPTAGSGGGGRARRGEVVESGARLPGIKRSIRNCSLTTSGCIRERDPDRTGLVVQVHPWETGLDTTPSNIVVVAAPAVDSPGSASCRATQLDRLVNVFGTGRGSVASAEHSRNTEAIAFYVLLRRLRRNHYAIDEVLANPGFAIQDLTYNCILVRANQLLVEIAETIGETIPTELAREHASKQGDP